MKILEQIFKLEKNGMLNGQKLMVKSYLEQNKTRSCGEPVCIKEDWIRVRSYLVHTYNNENVTLKVVFPGWMYLPFRYYQAKMNFVLNK